MASTAQYLATPVTTAVTISTANTAFDGSGTVAIVFTAGASGARIDRVVIEGLGTTAAGLVTIFKSDDATSNTTSNTHLYDVVAVGAVTASTTVAPFTTTCEEYTAPNKWPLTLPAGATLRVGTTIAQSIKVTAVGGSY